jgi:hypothetical protein
MAPYDGASAAAWLPIHLLAHFRKSGNSAGERKREGGYFRFNATEYMPVSALKVVMMVAVPRRWDGPWTAPGGQRPAGVF